MSVCVCVVYPQDNSRTRGGFRREPSRRRPHIVGAAVDFDNTTLYVSSRASVHMNPLDNRINLPNLSLSFPFVADQSTFGIGLNKIAQACSLGPKLFRRTSQRTSVALYPQIHPLDSNALVDIFPSRNHRRMSLVNLLELVHRRGMSG